LTLAAAEYGRAVGRRESRTPPPPIELVAAWRTRDYGLPRGQGWRNEPVGYLERMTHALNVYTAFKSFEDRGEMPEHDFAEQYFDLWKIVIDVEKLERDHYGK
jgi:hypothetical protein